MNDSVSNDLEYVRELAERGARAPLLGGRFLAWWGAMVTLAYLAHYGAVKGLAGLAPVHIPWIWGAFLVLGLGGYFTLAALFPRGKPGRGSAANQLEPVVWMFAGLAIFAFFIGLIVSQFVPGPSLSPNASLPLVFAVYALGLVTTGYPADNGALKLAGWTALVFVGLTVALQALPELYLVGALGAAVTVLIPGLALLAREPAASE